MSRRVSEAEASSTSFMDDRKESIVRYAPMDQVVIYPVTVEELAQFERGGSGSALLAFGMGLLGAGFGFLGCLLSASSQAEVTTRFVVLSALTTAFLVLGGILMISWYRQRSDVQKLAEKIRSRDTHGTGVLKSGP